MMPNSSHNENIPEMPFQVDHNDFIPTDVFNPDDVDLHNEAEIPQSSTSSPSQNSENQDSSESDNADENVQAMPTRSTTRIPKKPSWFDDYVMHCNTSSYIPNQKPQKIFTSPHSPPTYPYVESPLLTETHKSFLCSVSKINEPKTYQEASTQSEWVEAMKKELDALEENETWTVMPLPPGKKPIGSKWVYKVKLKPDGTVERFKARLVANGYNQTYGIDYLDSFSPVAKVVTVRLLLSLSTSNEWFLHQLDINNAFLHGYLDEEVYLNPPQGYSKANKGEVCKLNKSLYGLKQASRQWHIEFRNKLMSFGFNQSCHDHCLFTKGEGDDFLALVVYVDDVLITGPNENKIKEVKEQLHQAFTIKDLGQASYFLGVELLKTEKGLFVNQRKYIMDILDDAGLTGVKPTTTPVMKNVQLCSDQGRPLEDPEKYRRLVGRLLYLNFTRPDISYVVQQLSQFLHAPTDIHWKAALYVLKYLKGCPSKGLFFEKNSSPISITAYSDSDWATCTDTRRSLTGYCIFMGTSLISWKTKKQKTVSKSSCKAEYRSLAATVCELLWISYILRDLKVKFKIPVSLWCDNKSAIHITENPIFHERTKHLDIDCHLVRDQFKLGFVLPKHIPTNEQLADLFTKGLCGPVQFQFLLSKMHLDDIHQSPS